MSEEETHRNLIRALELAWKLECGIGWYDVSKDKEELDELYKKYQVGPYSES